jgi:hypothetical protein
LREPLFEGTQLLRQQSEFGLKPSLLLFEARQLYALWFIHDDSMISNLAKKR